MTQSTYENTETQPGATELTESDRFRVLAVERRRETLAVITDRHAPFELTDLATAVATRERDVETPTEETIEEVAVSLHHVHLPLMDDLGILDYVPDTNRVEACYASPDVLPN